MGIFLPKPIWKVLRKVPPRTCRSPTDRKKHRHLHASCWKRSLFMTGIYVAKWLKKAIWKYYRLLVRGKVQKRCGPQLCFLRQTHYHCTHPIFPHWSSWGRGRFSFRILETTSCFKIGSDGRRRSQSSYLVVTRGGRSNCLGVVPDFLLHPQA